MNSFKRLRAVLVATALTVAVIAPAAANNVETFSDSSRLVAVGGSLTEIVYALGEEKRLIARDSTSMFPPESEALPDVGYMRALSPEGLMSVDPSAILMLDGSGPPEALEVLRKASVEMVTVPETFDRAGILAKIEAVGRALGTEEKANQLAEKVGADIDAAEKAVAAVTERKRVLFILSMQGGRILASGHGTAADGIIAMAGGVNAVDGYEGYKPLTDEAVQAARPDVVLMMDRVGDHSAANDALFSHAAMVGTPAAQNHAVVRMDGAYLLGFGPRTAGAIRDLAHALYGDAVSD